MLKRSLLAVGGLIAMTVVVIVAKTFMYQSPVPDVEPITPPAVDADAIAERLAESVRFETITYEDRSRIDWEPFGRFNAWLEATYPRTHEALALETVNEYGLLYRWEGTDGSLKPLLLLGHTDVVPVVPGSEGDWEQPPFSGAIEEGFVWGRGTMDDKINVIGSMEAVEWLIAEGFTPTRTLYLSFGHDEEIGGRDGAKTTAALLKERGIELAAVIDEGGSIVEGIMPGVSDPVALIGIAEKGYVSLKLTVNMATGHSSMPPRDTAVTVLSEAIVNLRDNPFPGGLTGPSKELFASVGPEMSFFQRMLFANDWLFGPVIEGALSGGAETNAMLRTSIAPTIFQAGVKDNVIPGTAEAIVNFRVLPGDTIDGIVEHVRDAIDDERVNIEIMDEAHEASPVSPTDSDAYLTLAKSIQQIFPDAVVAPYLVLGGTDSRHFSGVSNNIYRFIPLWMGPEDMSRLHGTNERIGVETAGKVVQYYIQTIRNFCG